MITLYELPSAFGLPTSVSPYCTKLEVYFRLTGQEYTKEKGDIRKSPNKKVPYVKWPDGSLQADSDEIIARLEVEAGLDAGLAEDDAVRGAAAAQLAQRVLYFGCLYARFADPAGWEHQKPAVKGLVPAFLAPVLVPVIRRSQVKLCAANGFASPSAYAAGVEAATTLSQEIRDKPFLLGDTPRTADCAVWAVVMQTAFTLASNPPREAVRNDPVLMGYIERVADCAHLTLPDLA